MRRINDKLALRPALALVALLSFCLSMLVPAAPSGAAGNADLAKLIIPSPFPTWTPIPESRTESFSSYLNGVETAAIAPFGLTSTSVAGGWEDNATKSQLIIALIEIDGKGQTTSSAARLMHPAAKSGAASFCSGAEASAPVSLTQVSGLPNAYLVVCPGTASGTMPMGISMTRSNILAFLISTQHSTSSQELESIAREQYAALPSSISSSASSSSGSTSLVFIAVGIVVIAIAGVVAIISIRKRKSRRASGLGVISKNAESAGLPAAGWYPDPNRPGTRRYWTGSQWGPDQSEVLVAIERPDDQLDDDVIPPSRN